MRKITVKCLLWYSQLLSAVIAILGVVSCSGARRAVKEGADGEASGVVQPKVVGGDSLRRGEMRLMYGVPPTRFVPVEHRVMYGPPPVAIEPQDTVTAPATTEK